MTNKAEYDEYVEEVIIYAIINYSTLADVEYYTGFSRNRIQLVSEKYGLIVS